MTAIERIMKACKVSEDTARSMLVSIREPTDEIVRTLSFDEVVWDCAIGAALGETQWDICASPPDHRSIAYLHLTSRYIDAS